MSYSIDRKYYDKDGNETEDEKLACAKIVFKTVDGSAVGVKSTVIKHFVKYAGYVYDPVNMSEVDARYRNWQMKEVSKRTFDIYLDFLKTKQEHFRINAERFINAQA